jgi:hypothetical protein
MEKHMKHNPTYDEIKSELEAAIGQAFSLPTEAERLDFVARSSLDLKEKRDAGLLSQSEYWALNLKLALFAKEAYSASELLDDLSTDSWLLH